MMDLLFRGRRLAFESPLSREEVTRRLQREVAPPAWTWYEQRPQLFEGTFADDRFRMVRLVRGRNSFRPVIEGRLLPGRNGVRIEVQLKLHPLVLILCGLLVVVGGSIAVLVASELSTTRQVPPQVSFVVWMAVVFSVFLVVTLLEARKAARLLADVFESEPSPGRP
jgi:hypothetical protein